MRSLSGIILLGLNGTNDIENSNDDSEDKQQQQQQRQQVHDLRGRVGGGKRGDLYARGKNKGKAT